MPQELRGEIIGFQKMLTFKELIR
jgi:hypothetical protein